MGWNLRYLPNLAALLLAWAAQWRLYSTGFGGAWRRPLGIAGALASAGGLLATLGPVARLLPDSLVLDRFTGAGLLYAIVLVAFVALRFLLASVPVERSRRDFLAALPPVALIGYGVFIERDRLRLVETNIAIPHLPADLEGLRIAQLTDIHYGAYFGSADLERAIGLANETRPHLAMVTGDFITLRGDHLDECLALLRSLRADAGVYGCLGNHEIVADCEDYAATAAAKVGIRILRHEAALLRVGAAELNLAGTDYQRTRAQYLRGMEKLVRPGSINMLLSHNPDPFPVAAEQGWDLTIAGHTHGGQIDVEILGEHLNPARFFTPYIYGHYQKDGRGLLVSRGLGTVGAPIRAGAPPEVNLIRLVRG